MEAPQKEPSTSPEVENDGKVDVAIDSGDDEPGGRAEKAFKTVDEIDDPEIGRLGDDDEKKLFPRAFYCPLTEKLFEDPVVLSDGVSRERCAVRDKGIETDDAKMYPNRALQTIIEEVKQQNRSVYQQVQASMRSSMSLLLEKTGVPTNAGRSSISFRPLPEGYYCPITMALMHDPVIDPEGTTYERAVIYNWIRVKGTSPITRTSMSVDDLYPNNVIRELLEGEKAKAEGTIHPSIRKWKAEKPPEITDADVGGNFQEDPELSFGNLGCCGCLILTFVLTLLCVFTVAIAIPVSLFTTCYLFFSSCCRAMFGCPLPENAIE